MTKISMGAKSAGLAVVSSVDDPDEDVSRAVVAVDESVDATVVVEFGDEPVVIVSVEASPVNEDVSLVSDVASPVDVESPDVALGPGFGSQNGSMVSGIMMTAAAAWRTKNIVVSPIRKS